MIIGDPRSTYVRGARMAFAEKGIAYALEPQPPHSDPVKAIHPLGKIPAFRSGKLQLFETSAIMRYVLQYIFPKGADGKPDQAVIGTARTDMARHFGILEAAYGGRNVLVGDGPTLADLLLAPMVFYIGNMPDGKDVLAPFPNVRRAHAAIAERESFKSTLPPMK